MCLRLLPPPDTSIRRSGCFSFNCREINAWADPKISDYQEHCVSQLAGRWAESGAPARLILRRPFDVVHNQHFEGCLSVLQFQPELVPYRLRKNVGDV